MASDVGLINAQPPPPETDDLRRIPSDRRRAGQILADGWPIEHVARQMGVLTVTVERWRESDLDFRDGYHEQMARLNSAAERGRTKILMNLDDIMDLQIRVAKDLEHRDFAQMSRYLVDKILVPQSIAHNTNDVNIDVAFHNALAATVEKLSVVRAAHDTTQAAPAPERPALPSGLPPLLVGEAAADSYGAKSLRVPGALDEKP